MMQIRFKAEVTKEMAWGKDSFMATITGVLQDDGTLKIDEFNGIEPLPEDEKRLNAQAMNW